MSPSSRPPRPVLGRRTLLGGGLAAGALGVGAACSPDGPSGSSAPSALETPVPDDLPTGFGPDRVQRLDYGPDRETQFAELRRTDGPSKGVVVIVHGGFWRSQYDLSLGQPLSAALVDEGWTALNVEYRRVGNGGGWPETFDDVAAAVDALAGVDDVDTSTVLTLGHSAGGHLAVWLAARPRLEPWRPVRVPITGAVSQAGVLDLVGAHEAGLGGGAVEQFLGGPPSDEWRLVDPLQQLPLDVPVRCVHGSGDDIVPLGQSETYVEAARAAGADAALEVVEGDHFVVIDPASEAWRVQLRLLEELRG
ncbi:prolyl oligopeptidase family serine peptidase [Nocardioides perillae]|uniref:Acetyl esterase/lipase n=1 Tax=Nocardioides perillae TaxID=1119534 RepID=A0A7Y9RU23_9ACTN|nr:acetyl esterase/lipase [Nocardioides perillae]